MKKFFVLMVFVLCFMFFLTSCDNLVNSLNNAIDTATNDLISSIESEIDGVVDGLGDIVDETEEVLDGLGDPDGDEDTAHGFVDDEYYSDEDISDEDISDEDTAHGFVDDDEYAPDSDSAEEFGKELDGINIKWKDSEFCAIAYLGDAINLMDPKMLSKLDEYYADEHPLLRKMSNIEQLTTDGNEVYLIIPRYTNVKFAVHDSSDGFFGKNLIECTGLPLLVICNPLDKENGWINGNITVLASIGTDVDKIISFYPYVDIKENIAIVRIDEIDGDKLIDITHYDGYVSVIPEEDKYAAEEKPVADKPVAADIPISEKKLNITGNWRLVKDSEEFGSFVYDLSFESNMNMSVTISGEFGHLVEKFSGTYSFVDNDKSVYPNGALVFDVSMHRAAYDSTISETNRGQKLKGSYTLVFDGDTVIMTHAGGDQFITQNLLKPQVLTYKKR